MFEALWMQEMAKQKEKAGQGIVTEETKKIEMKTRMTSAARDFFLSRKSLIVFAGISLLSAALTFYLYHYTRTLEFRRMQEVVKSIAATGASQFDSKDLDALREEKDWKKSEWERVVSQLETVRTNNDNLTFVYLFRKTKNDPKKMEFISDSHSRNPYANTDADPSNDVDADKDGIVDPEGHDKLQWPGQSYPDPVDEIFQAYEKPTVTKQMYEDEYGKVLSGFAPIKDASGRVAGVIGVDMKATLLHDRIEAIFQPFWYFLGFFLLLICVRFTAFNRSLLKELLSLSKTKTFLTTACVLVMLFIVVSYAMYLQMLHLINEQTAERLRAIAATTAMQIDYRDLEPLRFARDMKRPEYQRVFEILNKVRKENPDVQWAYILRLSHSEGMWEFVVDADSNYFLSPGDDYNNDGVITESEENVFPGFQYAISNSPNIQLALKEPVAETQWYSDQWGTFVSGYAPIFGADGKSVAIVGFDITVPQVKNIVQPTFRSILIFLIFSFISLLLIFVHSRPKKL